MRVLVVSNLFPPDFLGGYELGCSHVVAALRRAGHRVEVATSVPIGRYEIEPDVHRVLELPPIYNEARMLGVSPEVARHYRLQAHMVNATNVRALGRIMEEAEPDVVYLWNVMGLGGLGILSLLKHMGMPWVWHLMDRVPSELCSMGGPPIPQLVSEFGRLFEGRYVACSARVAGEIRAAGVDLGDRVRLVPNWVFGERRPARREFFGGGVLRLASASGLLRPEKGTDIIIETAALLRDQGVANISIDLFGRENDGRYRALVHRHGLEDIVRFRGIVAQADLVQSYAGFDVFAFPTWSREPFAFAPLEAAAAGCVPLISDDCGNAEWMVDGVHCLKARRTSEGFARRIQQILGGEVDLGAIGRRAQAVVQSAFHLDAVMPEIEGVLTEAASERRIAHGSREEFAELAGFAEGLLHILLEESQI